MDLSLAERKVKLILLGGQGRGGVDIVVAGDSLDMPDPRGLTFAVCGVEYCVTFGQYTRINKVIIEGNVNGRNFHKF